MKKSILSVVLLSCIFFGNALHGQTETSGRPAIYRATHEKHTELKHTKLRVNFDFEKEQMKGEEWLTASPYFYATDSLVLYAKGMLISEIALDRNGSRAPLKYSYANDQLKINLDKKYNRNETYTIYIKYIARPNEVKQKGSAAITDAKGLYFINPKGNIPGKPTQIWTQGETESSSAWFPTIDKPNQKTTQEMYITVPAKYVTLSNGLLKDQKTENNGQRTDHWVMDKPHSTYLFFMGVGDFAVVRDKWKNIPVDYYVEKEYEPYARQIFGLTPEMIEFFSKKLNYDYPWQKYAQMVGRDYVSGAMENTTATLHGEGAQQKPGALADENGWENTIAHELFHQWFGDLVTAESWSNITVNESFANYSEYLWNEYKYGKDQADYHLMNEIRGYKFSFTNFSKDLVRFGYASREDVFDGVSYNKGGAILHMLRNYLGDEAFFAGLNDYLKTNEYKNGEAHQLRLSFEKISGKDLNWFFNQWYYGNGHPKISYTTTYDAVKKQTTLTINQTQSPLFQFPIAVDLYDGGRAVRHNIWVDAKANSVFTLPANAAPALVNINADGVLLADITENKTPAQYLQQYQLSKDFLSRYQAVDYAAGHADDENSVKILSAALKDNFFRIRMKALSAIDLSKPGFAKLAAEVEKMAQSDPKTLVRGAAIGTLAKSKDKKYLLLYQNGVKEVSNSVRGNSLAALASIAPEQVAGMAAQIDLDGINDEDVMAAVLPVVVQNKIEKHMTAIAGQIVAFYPFIKMQNPELGTQGEQAYNWIMSSDNYAATNKLTTLMMQAKGEIANNPMAKNMMLKTLKDGLDKKTALLRNNPQNESLKQQVALIDKAVEAYQ